ncbi:hypothetical protein HQQ80_16185 [Microbacteriaceae bacterium VKM Ac-2855]|nr:hypothetical protein [Microbacteriaceae bacterium VKM Ac-2855]
MAWYDYRMRRLLSVILALAATVGLSGCTMRMAQPEDADVVVSIPPGASLPPSADAELASRLEAGDEPAVRGLADAAWVASIAAATSIPTRALEAYAGTAVLLAAEEPDCRVDWATLAGIGYVESRHGTIDGGELQENGRPTEPIYGPLLDGIAYDEVADNDGGALDGNAEFDRAMGPMQFIPTTWIAWHAGGSDPQNVDDAVLAAARYLCYSGDDLGTTDGWNAAIDAYNPAGSYAGLVAEAASRYAAAA